MKPHKAVVVIGVGADGCPSLTSRAAGAVAAAQVLVGAPRQLEFFPQFRGRKVVIEASIRATVAEIAAWADEHRVCVLASGDPLFFGIGALVAKAVGARHVEFLPSPTALQLGFARVGVSWSEALLASVHGRPLAGLANRVRSYARAGLMTDARNHPARIAAHLIEYGQGDFRGWVCESLGAGDERVRSMPLAELAQMPEDAFAPLNVVILERIAPDFRPPVALGFLHEDEFAKRMPQRGLITKRELRSVTLAALRLRPDGVLWDVGAASGSVAIESARLMPRGRVHAIEVDERSLEHLAENCRSFGTDNVQVHHGRAPEALADLPTPDSVFIGGSKGSLDAIMHSAWQALRPGGRFVVNAITLENQATALESARALGVTPDIIVVNIARSKAIASLLRLEAHNPVQVLCLDKPVEAGAEA